MSGLLLCSPGRLWPQAPEVSPEALRGLDGVAVLVRPLDEKLQLAGFQESHLRELAEGELKSAGIPVLQNESKEVPARAPALEITLTAVREPQGAFFVFDLDFKLRRSSLVRRGQSGGAVDAGWHRRWSGLVTVENLGEIDSRLRGFLQEFTSAYQTVNRPVAKRGPDE